MLEHVVLRRSRAVKRNDKDTERRVQRFAGSNVAVVFAWMKDPRVAGLVALHANVIRQPRGQLSGIHDGVAGGRVSFVCLYVQFSWPVTIFAAYCELIKRGLSEFAVTVDGRLRATAVAYDASGENGAAETV